MRPQKQGPNAPDFYHLNYRSIPESVEGGKPLLDWIGSIRRVLSHCHRLERDFWVDSMYI
jgi:hypothetical protein